MPFWIKPSRGRDTELVRYTDPIVDLLARGFAEKMDQNYSFGGSVRTGYVRSDTGRRVSVPGEFAQEQTGLLRSAVSYKKVDAGELEISYDVGLDAAVSDNASMLREYLAYIEGFEPVSASRFGLYMTGESRDTHDHMLQHLNANMDRARLRKPA
jgi:hypothetical protein